MMKLLPVHSHLELENVQFKPCLSFSQQKGGKNPKKQMLNCEAFCVCYDMETS